MVETPDHMYTDMRNCTHFSTFGLFSLTLHIDSLVVRQVILYNIRRVYPILYIKTFCISTDIEKMEQSLKAHIIRGVWFFKTNSINHLNDLSYW